MWSNQIDRFWLFNGKQLWRFETGTCTWTEVQNFCPRGNNIKRVAGVGLNIPSRATGYYLGGYSADDNSTDRRYFHNMVVFSMGNERTRSINLPDYVPIIAPGLAYLDIGAEGMLVVIGGQTEKDGTLAYVSIIQSDLLPYLINRAVKSPGCLFLRYCFGKMDVAVHH